jgi:putative transposase
LRYKERKLLIEPSNEFITISRQAELLGIARSTVYYKPVVDLYEIEVMRFIDEQYTKFPFYGSRRMTFLLNKNGWLVNRKRVQRLMRLMGIEAIYPKPNLSKPHPDNKIYPYLLRDIEINRSNQVWGTDITYIRLNKGWMYLVAIMDWFSRYVLSWELSNGLEVDFCIRALEKAFETGMPEIFNSDQGSQFTSLEFVSQLEQRNIQISMDGKGRAMDNIFTERLWRTIKYEEVYIKDYENGQEARHGINSYMRFYNYERPHQSVGNKTPAEVYFGRNRQNKELSLQTYAQDSPQSEDLNALHIRL